MELHYVELEMLANIIILDYAYIIGLLLDIYEGGWAAVHWQERRWRCMWQTRQSDFVSRGYKQLDIIRQTQGVTSRSI